MIDAGPLEGLCPFRERAELSDLAVAKLEAIGNSSLNPVGRAFLPDQNVNVCDDYVSVLQELLGLAGPFGPGAAPIRDVLHHFCNATISAGHRKALELDSHDPWVEDAGDGLKVIAIERSVELLKHFRSDAHELDSRR